MFACFVNRINSNSISDMPTLQLYFAYGSNMDPLQFFDRCKHSRYATTAVLRDYKFIITTTRGYASIIQCHGSQVEGVLYGLTEEDEDALDGNEGVNLVPARYTKEYLDVQVGTDSIEALVYVATDATEGPNPQRKRKPYAQTILNGAMRFALSDPYQRKLRRILTPMLA